MRGRSTSLLEAAAHRDQLSERRKEQNRNAQRRLRERREQYALRLENEVRHLHLQCRQHETENTHLKELLKRVNDQHGTIMDQFMSAYNEVSLCKSCGAAVQRSSSTDLGDSKQGPAHNSPSRSQSDACVTLSPAPRQRAVKLFDTSPGFTTSPERLVSPTETVVRPVASAPIARKTCEPDLGGRSKASSADSTLHGAMGTGISTPERRRNDVSDEADQRKTTVRQGNISYAPVPLLELPKPKPASTITEASITDPSDDVPRGSRMQQAPADLNVWLMHKQLYASSWQSPNTFETSAPATRTSCIGEAPAALSAHSQKEGLFSMALNNIGLTPNAFSSAAAGSGGTGDGLTVTDGPDMHRAATLSPWSQLLQVPLEREINFNP